VKKAYLAQSLNKVTNLWLMLGDNAYQDGTDAEYQAAVFDMYPELLRSVVLMPTLGNHDGHTADSATQTGPYYDMFTLPRRGEMGGVPSGTEAYYSFDYGRIHFICLDSYESDRSLTSPMLTWLREDLLQTNQDWIIAFWHHPPYSKGSHDTDTASDSIEIRANILPILEDGGVDLVLSGHSHDYERSFLLDGHYGLSTTLTPAMLMDSGDGRTDGTGAYGKPGFGPAPHAGAVYVVAGSSGQIGGGSLNHPAMYLSLNSLGSLVLEIDRNKLDASFLDQNGVRRDYFTILKETNGPPVAVAGAAVQAECTSSSGAGVTLDGSASHDPDSTPGTNDDIVSFEWIESFGLPAEALLGTGSVLSHEFPLGAHAVTLRVTDHAGATATAGTTVTVADTTPPEIFVGVSPGTLWPPNHHMATVHAAVEASDACGAPIVTLISVTSSEPDDEPGRGGGRTIHDIQGADIGTADFDMKLRAERTGSGDGRIYTITYVATDEAGLTSIGRTAVLVPHDLATGRGPRRIVDDGAHAPSTAAAAPR
jgi:calcineurin-like phosphoesterase family protein